MIPNVTLKMKIDPSGLIRGLHDVGHVMQNLTADLAGKPRPPRKPYPKRYSRMTARQYRASRRAYARAMKAHKRNLRTWELGPATPMASSFAALGEALRRSQEPT